MIAAGLQADAQLQFASRLLDAVGHAVITMDLAGTIAYWSRYAEVLYGWQASDMLGRNILDVTPASRGHGACAILACVQAGNTWSGDFLRQRRDGSTVLVHLTSSPIFDKGGVLIGIVSVSYALPTPA
jgi:PAS domain S-box-containing protein